MSKKVASDSQSYPSSKESGKSKDKPRSFYVTDEDDFNSNKRLLLLKEEDNRIKHKNFIFYVFAIFLIIFMVSMVISAAFGNYVIFVLFLCVFLILTGIIISYFVTDKVDLDDHFILKKIFGIVENFLWFVK